MERQNVIPTYHGMLFSLRKEGTSPICHNVEPVTKRQIMYNSTYMRPVETESRLVVATGWGMEIMGNYGLIGIAFQSCEIKIVLEMDDSNGYTKIRSYLITPNLNG